MKIISCLLLTLLVTVYSMKKGHADTLSRDGLKVHNLFQSNMVLQRGKPIRVWGWGDVGEKVNVSFAGKEVQTSVDKEGAWKVNLPAMLANAKGQTMIISCGTHTLNLKNLLIGDIWVIGGQSNMQHPLSRVEGGPMEIASANFPTIRLLTVPPIIDEKVKTNFPRRQKGKQIDGDWDICTPQTVREFSAIGYIFGRRLQMTSQTPVGLIDVSRWGTTVEAWTPRSILQTMEIPAVKTQLVDWEKKIVNFNPQKDLEARIRRYNRHRPNGTKVPTELSRGPQVDQNHPGNCYNSFIAPISGLAVKGAIYHQGFNNARADASKFYHEVFPKMISAWRNAFNDPKMPFGIISLCTDGTPQTLENYCESMMNFGIYVREAQYKTFLKLYKAGDQNIGFVSSYNLRHAWYHPQNKIPAGERIAQWALSSQYGFKNSIHWKPPIMTKMELKDGTILLHFDEEINPEETGAAIVGFAVSGKDKKYQPAHAEHLIISKDDKGKPKYSRNILVLRNPHVPAPIHFRYAWGRNPMGNLRASLVPKRHISFATQRSDDWEFWDVPHLKQPVGKREDRESIEKIREALRFIDLERRVKNARIILEENEENYKSLKESR